MSVQLGGSITNIPNKIMFMNAHMDTCVRQFHTFIDRFNKKYVKNLRADKYFCMNDSFITMLQQKQLKLLGQGEGSKFHNKYYLFENFAMSIQFSLLELFSLFQYLTRAHGNGAKTRYAVNLKPYMLFVMDENFQPPMYSHVN